MKKIILSIFLFLTFSANIFAQTNTITPEVTTTSSPTFEYFTVKVYTEAQSAWTGKVPMYVEFTATIDSDKVQIEWDAPSGVIVIPKYPQFFKVKAGQTYTYKALIDPQAAGTYNIAGNVIAWQANTNYTSSGNTLISFSENLLTDPVAPEYRVGVVMKWVLGILVLVVAGYVGYIYAVKSKKKFDKWFNLPD